MSERLNILWTLRQRFHVPKVYCVRCRERMRFNRQWHLVVCQTCKGFAVLPRVGEAK